MSKKNLEVKNVSRVFRVATGGTVEALKRITFSVQKGEFISFIGPSGCGKSTLIRLLAGLIEPTAGTLSGEDAAKGVVFQHYNLFPWLTVEENIEFGLLVRGVDLKKRKALVSHYVEVVGLRGFEHAYPKEISGGMQQRVALARALVTNPKILLLDEPFAALDVQTKRFMQDLLLQILQDEPRTVVFVTHDVEEAVFMSDTVYVMTARPGSIREKISINLPRPRDLETEFSETYIKIKKRIQKIITKEALGLMKLDLKIYKEL